MVGKISVYHCSRHFVQLFVEERFLYVAEYTCLLVSTGLCMCYYLSASFPISVSHD